MVDRAGVPLASDVAVVMALLFGHGDGEEWVAGPWCWWRFDKGSSQIVL
jgi:hypothetical protein